MYPKEGSDMRPYARREHLNRIPKISMNPFNHEVTSETFFELCAAISGCGGCREKFMLNGGPESRDNVRKKLKDILAQAVEDTVLNL